MRRQPTAMDGAEWFAVALAAVALLVAVLAAMGAGFALFHLRRHGWTSQVDCVHTAKQAWVDPESRDVESMPNIPSNGCKGVNGFRCADSTSAQDPNSSVPCDAASFKQLSGLHERLDNLESMLRKTLASCHGPAPPPLESLGYNANASVLRSAGDAHSDQGCNAECSPRKYPPEINGLSFGPTPQQCEKACPPETYHISLDERDSLRNSLTSLRGQLGRRDSQTTELHRQLRQCQEALWQQKLDATSAHTRLREVLTDPERVPAVQAEELRQLHRQVEELSTAHAEALGTSRHLQWIVRRQRAFFIQNEKMEPGVRELLMRHPAGEVFLTPPPVVLDEDREDDATRGPWDVGTSHINPYAVDSWPLEPNVLAQRCAAEPSLARLDEDGSGSGCSSARSGVSAGWGPVSKSSDDEVSYD